MTKYDFFIAGRWRNYPEVKKALDSVRAHNKTAYCFIENLYEGSKVEFKQDASIESIMQSWNPYLRMTTSLSIFLRMICKLKGIVTTFF